MATGPNPSLSITPGLKFSMTTSADWISSLAVFRSEEDFRSRRILRLPLFKVAFAGVSHQGPPGGSTLMTSAPWSARSIPVNGPAI